jgi:hypothetical protein
MSWACPGLIRARRPGRGLFGWRQVNADSVPCHAAHCGKAAKNFRDREPERQFHARRQSTHGAIAFQQIGRIFEEGEGATGLDMLVVVCGVGG